MGSAGLIRGKNFLLRNHSTEHLDNFGQLKLDIRKQGAAVNCAQGNYQRSDPRERQRHCSPDLESVFETQAIEPGVLEVMGQLYENCIEARKECRFDPNFAAHAGSFREAVEQARSILSLFPPLLEEFTLWNTVISRPWHTSQPPCYCDTALQLGMCEVCYQGQTGIKRPWYIENPRDTRCEDDDLCEDCKHINFSYLMSNWHGGIDPHTSVSIGLLREIVEKQRICAFCRLLVHALQTEYGTMTLNFTRNGIPLHGFASSTEELNSSHVSLGISFEPHLAVPHSTFQTEAQRELLWRLEQNRSGEDGGYYVEIQRLEETPKPGGGRPATGVCVDYSLLKRWIEACNHAENRQDQTFTMENTDDSSTPIPIRLIDVQSQCVKVAPKKARYLALSYVWGGCGNFKSTLANRAVLETPGGLPFQKLPRTVRDAITLVSRIGERYLWVDSICIIQDDEDYKQAQIRAMGSIFRSAVVTIVAHWGDSADAGLSGVTAHSPRIQHRQYVQGLLLANGMNKMSPSKWSSRAWTYQEELFSQRLLFFKGHQVIFSNEFGTYHEDTYEPDVPVCAVLKPLILVELEAHVNFRAYARFVDEYSRRDITFDDDALEAFNGILNYLQPLFQSEFLYGLPLTEIECSILWAPGEELERRVHPTTGLPIFPSWSWAGWKGFIKPSYGMGEHLGVISWIDTETGERFGGDELRNAPNTNFSRWRRTLDGKVFYQEDHPRTFYLHPVAVVEERLPRTLCRSGSELLHFETRSAILALHRGLASQHPANTDAYIYTLDGFLAGVVTLSRPSRFKYNHLQKHEFIALSRTQLKTNYEDDTIEDTEASDPELASLRERVLENYRGVSDGQATPRKFPGSRPYQLRQRAELNFQSFAEGQLSDPDLPRLKAIIDKRYRDLFMKTDRGGEDETLTNPRSLFDHAVFNVNKSWCLYDVMAINWENGIAYREGIGTCHVDAFNRAYPVTRQVILG